MSRFLPSLTTSRCHLSSNSFHIVKTNAQYNTEEGVATYFAVSYVFWLPFNITDQIFLANLNSLFLLILLAYGHLPTL